ncbi:hypothetical protein A3770_13p68220 [Chloropicon primus]|uniref:HTH HARE-type domain-containing protein n=2 Tax=Chloropicon primus TaxID=1764295 RepID=A0A5B8MXV5_9CHLO|nr:hypothetical protein A3770_13p68220 [Chloropicon primus]|eukprot:QDZ24304.1 hypothetical protein A3770_13p68220 [Chloropicon primus]
MRRPTRQSPRTHTRSTAATTAATTDADGDDKGGLLAKPTLRDAICCVLQNAGGRSLHYNEILEKIQANRLFVFMRKDGSLSFDPKKMGASVNTVCSKHARKRKPSIARTAPGTYAIAADSLNVSNIQDHVRPSPLGDAISRVLQDAGRSLRPKATTDADGDDKGGLFTGGPDPAQVLITMMRDNTHRMTARNRKTARNQKRTLRDAIYRVLQDAGRSLRVKEILVRIQAKRLYVFRQKGGSICQNLERLRNRVSSTCIKSPCFVRTARGLYAIAKEYLNRSTTG